MSGKVDPGNHFEDFSVGQEIVHATPRTVTEGDVAVYQGLFGSRFALQSATTVANTVGLERAPVDDFLTFHVVFGRTVPDVSLNAVANLGYAQGRFGVPVFPGDTLRATSRVTGVRETSSGTTGIVWVRTHGTNQRGETVVVYDRWVLVPKRDPDAQSPETLVPELQEAVPGEAVTVPWTATPRYDPVLAGSPYLWEDYEAGEKIDHVDGVTIEDSEHMTACRLFQNTARVHFNQHVEGEGRFGRRIIYGGYLISLARALSFNGLGNALSVVAINGGRHTAPTFAGDTVYAWSEVLDRFPVAGNPTAGALRLRTVATKNRSCRDHPRLLEDGTYDPAVVLDLDYTVVMPRRTRARD
ncbi:MAG: MaoC family dehydratase [Gemmatimonadota bacterium]